MNAKRILEFGTLAGYSTLWFARAAGPKGRVITLEANKRYAQIARENFKRASVDTIVEVMEGPATESVTIR
jgi:predicted O-methyltransferase YrrM